MVLFQRQVVLCMLALSLLCVGIQTTGFVSNSLCSGSPAGVRASRPICSSIPGLSLIQHIHFLSLLSDPHFQCRGSRYGEQGYSPEAFQVRRLWWLVIRAGSVLETILPKGQVTKEVGSWESRKHVLSLGWKLNNLHFLLEHLLAF